MTEESAAPQKQSAFARYAHSLRICGPQMRAYRPTFFSPTNHRWVSAPSICHFNRALELEFGNVLAYEIANYRLEVAGERGLVAGALDCWIATSKADWVETFVADEEFQRRDGSGSALIAARTWCAVRGITHCLHHKAALGRTTLSENRRRLIGSYKAEIYETRLNEISHCSSELLQLLQADGPCTVSQLLKRGRSHVPPELSNVVISELIRRGNVDADLASGPYDSRSRLIAATNSQPHPA